MNIDSTWSECINNFKFDKKKFPHPEQIVPYFHEQGIKVILVSFALCLVGDFRR